MKWNRHAPRVFLAALVAGSLISTPIGCSYFENAGTISGTVRYKGQPLREGSVSFVNDKGRVVTAIIDPVGHYAVAHVPAGSAKVTVQVVPTDGQPPVSFGPLPTSMEATSSALRIPCRFAVPATSGLRCEVTKGDQQFDIDILE